MKNLDPKRARWIRNRALVAMSAIALLGIAVGARAYRVQIRDGANLGAQARQQQERPIRIMPKRGTLFDRNGHELAVSVDVDSIYANPRAMRTAQVDLVSAATRLATVLHRPVAELNEKLQQDRFFVWLSRHVTPEVAHQVRALNIDGVTSVRESRRFYPQRTLAAHVLGFSSIDGVGLEGVEHDLNESLRGHATTGSALRDRRGNVVFGEHLVDQSSQIGDDVYLTLDSEIQAAAEHELALAVRTFEAQAGSVVVLDPQNGDVLALTSYPTFDPNRPGDFTAAERRLRAVTDRFEPGSTVKPFTLAAAFASGVVSSGQRINCENGTLTIGEDEIHDSHPFAELTPAEILAYSSNIGTAKIGFSLGKAGLYRAFRRFGFGERTGIQIPGETEGILRHYRRWYDFDLATASFGQGISVTALQLASAMGVLAAEGRLYRPTLVHRMVTASGAERAPTPALARQVIPARVARLIGDMLTSVTTEEGTGVEASIPGFVVAGKTGTAQKADYVHGGYARGLWTASFVGFVPAERPRLVIAVIIDEPTMDHYGGAVAGPVFRRVGAAALARLGLVANASGEVPRAIRATPARATRANRAAAGSASALTVPDFSGQTMRQAFAAAAANGIRVVVRGSGLCDAQEPPAGVRLSDMPEPTVQLTFTSQRTRDEDDENASSSLPAQVARRAPDVEE